MFFRFFFSGRNNKELKSNEATLLLVNSLHVTLGEGELQTSGHPLPQHVVQWRFQLIRVLQSHMKDPRIIQN